MQRVYGARTVTVSWLNRTASLYLTGHVKIRAAVGMWSRHLLGRTHSVTVITDSDLCADLVEKTPSTLNARAMLHVQRFDLFTPVSSS